MGSLGWVMGAWILGLRLLSLGALPALSPPATFPGGSPLAHCWSPQIPFSKLISLMGAFGCPPSKCQARTQPTKQLFSTGSSHRKTGACELFPSHPLLCLSMTSVQGVAGPDQPPHQVNKHLTPVQLLPGGSTRLCKMWGEMLRVGCTESGSR
jgi:hypothetical protein